LIVGVVYPRFSFLPMAQPHMTTTPQSAQPATLLLTGATGFLGGAIMARLIEGDQWDNTLFLVRAATPEEGLARLTAVLRRFEVPERLLWRFSLS